MTTRATRLGHLALRLLVLTAGLGSAASAGDQPQWGERFTRNMVSEEKNLPDTFDPKAGKNIAWSVPLGSVTHGTPVVAAGKVLIGTNNAHPRDSRQRGDRGVLLCLDEKDGSLVWQLVVPKLGGEITDNPNQGFCSPPTVEGDRVYTVTNRDEVVCLDLQGMANGNDGPYRDEARHMMPKGGQPVEPRKADADILWLFDILAETGVHLHDSAHVSPLIVGQFLYVNTSNGLNDGHTAMVAPEAPSLIVLDKATGRLVAREREDIGVRTYHCTWSSPALAEVDGKPLVIFCGGDGVVHAFEPLREAPPDGQVATLKQVWALWFDPSAPRDDVQSYLPNRKEGKNRQEGPSNVYGMPVVHGGHIFVAGGGDVFWGKAQSWLKCIDAAKGTEVWSYPLKRHVLATPAVRDGLAYIADTSGLVHCVDAATGKACWTQQAKGDFWASPLVADGKVYVATRRGEVMALAAGRELKVLSRIDFGEGISATPVAANGTLYIATLSRLYAIRKEVP